jgi:hypothetical protein
MTDERPPEGEPESSADQAAAETPPPSAAPPASVPPAYTPPPVPPPVMPQPAMAQPAVAWAPPPAAAVATGQRTGMSLAAGIILIVLGILGALLGLLLATVGRGFVESFQGFNDLPGFNGADPGAVVGGIVTFFGIVLLVGGVAYIFGGVGVLRSRGWGRVIGIVVGIIGGLFWLASLGGSGQYANGGGGGGGGLFAAIFLALHVYVIVALGFFWRAKASMS